MSVTSYLACHLDDICLELLACQIFESEDLSPSVTISMLSGPWVAH